jgi:uncharacterized protein (TIGR02300 family)
MVPLPLAAGPSTAITSRRCGASGECELLFKRRALTAPNAYGKARADRAAAPFGIGAKQPEWSIDLMVKPEWGTKRTCPKCSTRFYDLGKEDPVHCIECGTEWIPEPVLKSKQPMPFEASEPEAKDKTKDEDLEAEDLNIDEDEEPSADDEVDLATDDDDLGVKKGDDEEES